MITGPTDLQRPDFLLFVIVLVDNMRVYVFLDCRPGEILCESCDIQCAVVTASDAQRFESFKVLSHCADVEI